MDDAPIACSLGADDRDGRVADWRRLLAGVTERTPVPDGLRLAFGEGVDAGELARLAAAEQGCCAFFAFALTVDARGTALEVRAPADGAAVLHELFGSC